MYKVINTFTDKQDGNRMYKPGDIFPAEGVKATKARINELSHRHPQTGKIYIEEVEEMDEGGTGEGEGGGEDLTEVFTGGGGGSGE